MVRFRRDTASRRLPGMGFASSPLSASVVTLKTSPPDPPRVPAPTAADFGGVGMPGGRAG